MRNLVNLASAVSLVFCVATGALWLALTVRGGIFRLSHRPNDVVSLRSCTAGSEGEFEYSSFHDPSGRIVRYITESPAQWEPGLRLTGSSFAFPCIRVSWGRVYLRGADAYGPFHVRIVRVHYGEIIAFTLTLPLLWALRRIVNRTLSDRRGQCHQCGYNLTANTSGVCPECGAAGRILK